MEKRKIKVVHDNDLENLLSKFALLEAIKTGKRKCKFCGSVITIDNILAVVPESGSVQIVCDSVNCIKMLNLFLEKTRKI